MTYIGISNSNEFYSAHYLDSILEKDCKEIKKRWDDQAVEQANSSEASKSPTPDQAFKALKKPWRKLREEEGNRKAPAAERLAVQRELFFAPLLDALGYAYAPKAELVVLGEETYQVPLLAQVNTTARDPLLWVVECFNPEADSTDPLDLEIHGAQITDPSLGQVLPGETWEDVISDRVLGQTTPPRWVLAVSRDQVVLIDRQKWAASRLLRFEFNSLLGENNPDAQLAAATLLHREHTCPSGGGTPKLDEFDENSHKHANEVSTNLKYALRRSIELLGNEAIHWRKSRNEGVFKGKTDAEQLTLECLRYMYRLLFLFYIESRPDLGYAPMGSDVYRLGYSLESLRDLDSTLFGSEEDKESTYISDSLDRLFQMIWQGYPERDNPNQQLQLGEDDTFSGSFRLTPLKAHLFDPQRMPLLSKVRFRNEVMRQIIAMMSLTKAGKGKGQRVGRVSYAQLGINQLGAVYEALLSFRGFFAEEDLYEVQPAPKKQKKAKASADDVDDEGSDAPSAEASGKAHDELEVGYFVNAEQLKAYKADEIVAEAGSGKPKCHPKGSFIYRLAGRDREKSASYYTPECLTQCLVKYALKELLPGKTAQDILELKVCEPAMGSAAFLNEVVNQLAQKYLELRQQETGQSIGHEHYAQELQKVKMRLADQNVFGVDLNPVAVELAEVSLWLNSIFSPEEGRAFVPWFGQQLVCGNSLIGARRQIYRVNQLPTGTGRSTKPKKLWHEHAPEDLAWDAEVPDDGIFHFLMPDPGMAAYDDKVIKELEPEGIERCKRWNKAFVHAPFTQSQINQLLRLSKLIDALWKTWAAEQHELRQRTTDPLPVWQDPTDQIDGKWTSLQHKDRIQQQEVEGRGVANTNARLRLKWAMDYWVTLWFWPIQQADSLPSRDQWLLELSMILGDLEQGVTPEEGQRQLFPDTQPKQLAADFSDQHGFVDIQKLKTEFKRFKHIEKIIKTTNPIHWHLEFSDIFKTNKGFDLTIGNPPWIRTTWQESHILAEYSPIIKIRGLRASEIAANRTALFKSDSARQSYLFAFKHSSGFQNYFSSQFPLFTGESANLYKAFIDSSISIIGKNGVTGLIHPDGVYIDPGCHNFREESYGRKKYLFQFRNELKLFDILNTRTYCISIWREKQGTNGNPNFSMLAKLFHPSTIDESLNSTSNKDISIKNTEGKWNTEGSQSRVVTINLETLKTFSLILGETSPHTTRLFPATSNSLVNILKCFCLPKSLGSKDSIIYAGLDETSLEKGAHISKKIEFPEKGIVIVPSPQFSPNNPLAKTARKNYSNPKHFDSIDLTATPNGYVPRTIFHPEIPEKDFKSCHDSQLPWDNPSSGTYINSYKLLVGRRLDPETERTLQAAIFGPDIIHTNTVQGITFKHDKDLAWACAFMGSIPYDFLIKASGRKDIYSTALRQLPWVEADSHETLLRAVENTLMLNCLNSSYKTLWERICAELNCFKFPRSNPCWQVNASEETSRLSDWNVQISPARTHLERYHLAIENDILVSRSLNLNLADLTSTYRLQFPVMQSYESDTWFDSKGKIIFSPSKGLSGVSIPRKGKGRGANRTIGWEDIRDMQSGTVSRTIIDDTMPGGAIERTITYEAPFDRCDRVEDYRIAWEFFEKEGVG